MTAIMSLHPIHAIPKRQMQMRVKKFSQPAEFADGVTAKFPKLFSIPVKINIA